MPQSNLAEPTDTEQKRIEQPTTGRRDRAPAVEDAQPHGPAPIGDDVPRMEPWLWVVLSATVPVMLAFLLPRSALLGSFAASGILVVAGILMLVVQERRKGGRSTPAGDE